MSAKTNQPDDESDLRQLIAEQAEAICAKNVPRIMACYAPDVVFFDVKPPYQTRGADDFRLLWEQCLPCFPDTFQIEQRDLRVLVNGDLAMAHWLFRFAGMDWDHPAAQSWYRTTACYRRKLGRWQVVHEHVSVPFDPRTSLAFFTLDPESHPAPTNPTPCSSECAPNQPGPDA
jgi:uncharacterized protein (TIGR02246 family)